RRRSGLRPHRISQLFPRSTVLPVVDLGQSGRTVVDAEAGQGPASVRLRDRQDRLGHANGSFGQPAGKAPQARNASANGSTEVAPALRSSLAQIVIVHRETTSSSTSSTDFPATACSISGGTTKASYRSLTRKALLTSGVPCSPTCSSSPPSTRRPAEARFAAKDRTVTGRRLFGIDTTTSGRAVQSHFPSTSRHHW